MMPVLKSLSRSVVPLLVLANAWAGAQQTPAAVSQTESLYFSLKAPFEGSLTADDVTVFEDGEERRVVELVSAGDEIREATSRQFIFFFDDDLNFRQLFYAKRAVMSIVPDLRDTDSVAVYRSGKLSGFFQGTQLIKRLVAYFGAEVDRFEEGAGIPFRASFSPRSNEPDSESRRQLILQESRDVFRNGVNGSLGSVLGYNRYNEGRKVVFYFGSNLPYEDPKPELVEPATAALFLADARTALYGFYFGSDQDWRFQKLQGMSEQSGGQAWAIQLDPTDEARQAFASSADFYYLRFETDGSPDTRFREVRLHVSGAEIQQRTLGYFKTVDRVHNLAGRTFDSVLLAPHLYRDIPLVVDTNQDPGELRVKISFPFSDVRFDVADQPPGLLGDRYFQTFWLLLLVQGEDGVIIRAWARKFHLDLAEQELLERLGSRATIEEKLPISKRRPVGRVQVVLVAGMNRQIGYKSSDPS